MAILVVRVDDNAGPLLERVARTLPRPRQLFAVWGQRIAKTARERARAKGGKSFWRDVAAATRVESISDFGGAVANYHVAGGHKQTGGPIERREAGALTIPITAEAKRKRAGEFAAGGRDLFTWLSQRGNTILGYADKQGMHPLYVLVSRVKMQQPDKWFPEPREIGAFGLEEGQRLLRRGGIA